MKGLPLVRQTHHPAIRPEWASDRELGVLFTQREEASMKVRTKYIAIGRAKARPWLHKPIILPSSPAVIRQ